MPLFNVKNVGWTAIAGGVSKWLTAYLDWNKRKEITINAATVATIFSDDFSVSDAWTDIGTLINVNEGTNNIDWDALRTATNSATDFDLVTALNATKWVTRFDFTIDANTATTSGTNELYIVLSDSDETVDSETSQSFIGLQIERGTGATSPLQVIRGDASTLAAGTATQIIADLVVQNATLYCEIIRQSDTRVVVNVYRDSGYTEVVATETVTIVTGIDALDHIKVMRRNQAADGGTLNGTIGKVEVWDAVTVVDNIPNKQTGEAVWGTAATLSIEDFTSYTDQADADLSFVTSSATHIGAVDVGADNLPIDTNSDATNDNAIAYDIGVANISDEKWVLRMSVDVTTFTKGTTGTTIETYIGLSDSNQTVVATGAQDYFGLFIQHDSTNNKFTCIKSDGTAPNAGAQVALAHDNKVEKYYLEIIRHSATRAGITIYSDAAYTHVINTAEQTIEAGIVSLRYLKFMNRKNSASDGRWTGTIDDIEFWNNITEVHPTTFTDYPLEIKITGDTNLKRKTTETEEETGSFTSYTETGGQDVVKGTGVVDYDIQVVTTRDDAVWKDIGLLSDSLWRMDYDLDISSFTHNTDPSPQSLSVILSDIDGTNALDATQDAIVATIATNSTSGDSFILNFSNGGNPRAAGTAFGTFTQNKFFITLKRLSTILARMEVYQDKARTILLFSREEVVSVSTINLRYLRIQGYNDDNTGVGTLIGTVSNVRVWDNVVNAVNQEAGKRIFGLTDNLAIEDFTTYTTQGEANGNWAPSVDAAGQRVDIVTNLIDHVVIRDATDDSIEFNLGKVLSNKAWIFRFKHEISAYTAGVGVQQLIHIGSVTGDSEQTMDALGIYINGDTVSQFGFLDADGAAPGASLSNDQTETFAVSDIRFIEIRRDSETKMTISWYSDANYSILINSITQTIAATIRDLQFIKIQNVNQSTQAGTMTTEVDDIEIWDGISSPNATGNKFVFSDNLFNGDGTEIASHTISYDPIAGDLHAFVKVPSLSTTVDSKIQMYYDYQKATDQTYIVEPMPDTRGAADFVEDYADAVGWTEVGASSPDITGGKFVFGSAGNQADRRFHRALGITLDDEKWVAEFEVNWSTEGSNSNETMVFVLSNGTAQPLVLSAGTGGSFIALVKSTAEYYLMAKDGTDVQIASLTPRIADGGAVLRYARLQRLSATEIECRLFSDSARTVQESQTVRFTISPTIKGLDSLQHGNANPVRTNTTFINYTIDNANIWNGDTYQPIRENEAFNPEYRAVYHLEGDAVDSTGTGHDGTETAEAYTTEKGSLVLNANATTTKIDCGTDEDFDDMFKDSGAHVSAWINPKSDGENNVGKIVDKNGAGIGWEWEVSDESAGLLKLAFEYTTNAAHGTWRTTNTVIPINEFTKVDLFYNKSSLVFEPTFVINGVVYKVGSGLDVVITPTGTIDTDAAAALIIGNNTTQAATFDGFIEEVRLSKLRKIANWISQFNNEKLNSTFISIGAQRKQ